MQVVIQLSGMGPEGVCMSEMLSGGALHLAY